MHELTQLIKDDMRPALGVTEPGAIAYAVSKAKSYVSGELEQVTLLLNSGMYKNAYTCGIPNSHFYGNEYAAALGVVAGKPEKELESLADVAPVGCPLSFLRPPIHKYLQSASVIDMS